MNAKESTFSNVPANPAFDEDQELVAPVAFDFGLDRRGFVQLLSAGLLITTSVVPALAQQRAGRGAGRSGAGAGGVAARLQVGKDGIVTVFTGKIEMGQGGRAELTQAAAEELRLPVSQVRLVMGDTRRVPDDGVTAGSRTTPGTVPVVRQAAAAARQILAQIACERWSVEASAVEVGGGRIRHPASNRTLAYGELAQSEDLPKAFARGQAEAALTRPDDWKVLGTSVRRPNYRDLVTGAHQFPSDLRRPGMLHGKILRPPTMGAKLTAIDLEPAKALPDTVVVRDGQFVGVAAPTSAKARAALEALARTAQWEAAPHPSSREVYDYLRQRARGGVPSNPFAQELPGAHRVLRQTYHTPYVQHCPLETRVALAEWQDGQLTVWTCTQNPFGYHGELARAFRLANDQVRVVVPDFGSGFGGKHTGECAVEAARLAQAAGRPVLLKWTREEEFTWAYFRPAAVIDIEASLNAQGQLATWHFININSGGAAVESPYRIPHSRSSFVQSETPLRQGSYRALASVANNFAREAFMDELAAAAGADPLEFRLAHLENPRLRAVLQEAARRFNWGERAARKSAEVGVGLACGTEKGSFVAACVEIAIQRPANRIVVRHVCEVFECGAILNPDNLVSQTQGGIIMALGPALREEMQFAGGKILNPRFAKYLVPRFSDVPVLDLHFLDRKDLSSLGGGETPLIPVAPAIANALHHATGVRVHELPIRLPGPEAGHPGA